MSGARVPGVMAAAGSFLLLLVLCPLLMASPATSAAASCTATATTTTSGMNPSIVVGAYAEAVARNASPRVLLALFEAGLDESSFRNLANDSVPSSLTLPHDGVGNDHTSVGYLQQQVGADGTGALFGWGDVEQAMDTVHATDAFLNAAIPLDATVTGDAATLAQAVQASATSDGSNYRAFAAQATALLAAQAGGNTGTPVTGPFAAPSSSPPVGAPSSPAVARPTAKLSPSTGTYVGAYTGTTGLTTTVLIEAYFKQREGLANRNFAIHNFMPGWNQPLASDLVRWDLAQGTIPLISWNTPDGMSDQSIADGSQDAWIRTQADGVKALGADVFVRLDWEMNGNWFAWDGTHNGGPSAGPASFVAMWRHIHDVFVQEGATNVAWVWTPASASLPDTSWNAMTAYYPGDTYVDWVGEDDYNYGGTLGHSLGWNDFTSQLQPLYGTYATRKPIMIGEMGSVDGIAGHDKGQWITTMAAQVKADYPDVQALVWFDTKYDADWRFDTSPSSLAAFRAWLADPYYNPTSRAETVSPVGGCAGDGGDGTDPGGPTGTTSTTTLPNAFTITGTAAGIQAVQYALAQLGKPYVYGTSGPNSFDCSGLTMASWAAAGVNLPHFTGDQVNDGAPEPVDLLTAQAGDLVFIPGADGTMADPRHVGMVAGTTTDASGTHLYLVEAPHTGANVELIPATNWTGRIADVRHIG